MTLRTLCLSFIALTFAACASAPTDDPTPPETAFEAIDSTTLRRHLAELASDRYEGRGTGTRGESLAVQYIAAQMQQIGLAPGAPDGSYLQQVPLLGSTPLNVSPLVLQKEGQSTSFNFVQDFIVATDLDAEQAALDGELVFVGYGISNPGYNWDDFKGMDLTGKILVAFVNDPPATEAEPGLFQADTLTYNGRWTYKYEEARRRGAAGVLLIHTLQTAGYPFQVLSATASGEQIGLATPPENPLLLKGWVTRPVGEKIAEMAGTTLDAWYETAASRDFQPQPTGIRVLVSSDFSTRRFSGTNVIGKIEGRTRPGEAIIYTAHHDHLGKNDALIAQGKDGIYNGAVDNASGVSMLLTLAKAFTTLPEKPDRTIFFATLTAEESGLLGASHYAENPAIPLNQTIANLNVDSGNLGGRTRDIVGIGAERSEMKNLLHDAAAAENLTVTPDPQPNQGLFYRSDQLAFARGGVPAVFFNTGRSFEGQPDDYADTYFNDYRMTRYHQPADELTDDMRFGGMVQQTRVAFRMGYRLANTTLRPAWNPSEAFAEARGAATN